VHYRQGGTATEQRLGRRIVETLPDRAVQAVALDWLFASATYQTNQVHIR
jgi:hypothetical protein